jgi:hypothetical protein
MQGINKIFFNAIDTYKDKESRARKRVHNWKKSRILREQRIQKQHSDFCPNRY